MRVDDRLCRHDLTDEEWQRLLPMMPADARRGRRWSNHRMVINGILFRTRAGCPWRDLPGEYGHWKTAYNRGTIRHVAEPRRGPKLPKMPKMPMWTRSRLLRGTGLNHASSRTAQFSDRQAGRCLDAAGLPN